MIFVLSLYAWCGVVWATGSPLLAGVVSLALLTLAPSRRK